MISNVWIIGKLTPSQKTENWKGIRNGSLSQKCFIARLQSLKVKELSLEI